MKKCYKLTVHYDDDIEEIDSLSEVLEDSEAEGVWLDIGDTTVLLPPELAKCLEQTGILGLA
jgi:hypothetical protein